MMTFYIRAEEDKVADFKFKTFGCIAAIAVSNMISEMAKGKTVEEASMITRQSVADALSAAIKDYRS
jgi:nitrogen fixation NifU-like protein